MRHGYGYERSPEEMAELDDVAKVWVDTRGSQRAARAEMIQALRPGDQVVVLQVGDLARGRGYEPVLREIMTRGAEIVAPPPDKRPRGSLSTFRPTPDADAKIREAWHNPGVHVTAAVLDLARELTGMNVNRGQLYYRYGTRTPD